MLQRFIGLASVLLTMECLVTPVMSLAEAQPPTQAVTQSLHQTPLHQTPLHQTPLHQTPAEPSVQQVPFTIPATLAPYLDPSIHPDLRFEPDVLPNETNPQALRLEIRLSRRQVTLYQGATPIKSYAIAVGRPGWETPVGVYEVKQMIKNPTWVHPLEKGVVIPGGDPENPLGRYWIGFWTDGKNWIGFHGTPTPRSVGKAASHGCIRMYNKDIEALFQQVTIGTVVTVVK